MIAERDRGSRWGPRRCIGLLLLGALGATEAGAQSGQDDGRSIPAGLITAARLSEAATASFALDGLLSEEFWADGQLVTDLRQKEPLAGQAATERTAVRIAYDDVSPACTWG